MSINYNVKGTGLAVSDEIRSYLEKRLAHIEKFLYDDSTAHVDVELEYQTSEDRKKYRAEFTLSRRGNVHRIQAQGDSLHESIDIAVGDLSRDLSQSKKKRLHVLRRSAVRVKEFVRGFRNRF